MHIFLQLQFIYVFVLGCIYFSLFYAWNITGTEPPHDKTNKMHVRPTKTQISLGIRPIWSESSLCAQWVAKDSSFLYADSEDSHQTGRMPRLTWVFAGRTPVCWVCHVAAQILNLASKKTVSTNWGLKEINRICNNDSIYYVKVQSLISSVYPIESYRT